jgi:phospholipid/cholesterol/gamma-HCH transport system substrate-binding protein
MPRLSSAAKVGVMTILLVAAIYVAYRFIAPDAGTRAGYSVYAYLPDLSGVAPRSRVMISGVQVGVIDRISLDKGRARVDVRMRPEFKLYQDATIGRRASSLIGEYFVVLAPGTEGKPEIPDGGEVRFLMPEATIQGLQEQLREILLDVKDVTATLKNTVGSDTGQKQIADILKNIAQVTEELAGAVKENRGAVREAITNVNTITQQSTPEINAILKNVRQVTTDLKDLLATKEAAAAAAGPGGAGTGQPGAGGEPKAGELRNTIERVNRASESLENVLQHADNVAARIDRGEGTVGRLTKDETLINEVEDVVAGVGDLVGGIGRLQTVVGLREDYNFLANTIKSYVEIRLQPTEDKYYLFEIVNDPRGLTSVEQIDVDTTNPNDPPHYREIRTVTTNSWRFSFQFAKRLGPFTGRFGIRESTGGIGVDLHLLNDRFELRQDLFGFGEQLYPRWRVALSYEFIRTLWLLGGVDNIFSNDRRDYFIGLQLRFTDEDLKSILPFAPSGL